MPFENNFTGKIPCIQVSYSERQKQNKRAAKKRKENISNKLQTYYLDALRILTGKKHCQIKLQHLQNVQIWTFGLLVQHINSL